MGILSAGSRYVSVQQAFKAPRHKRLGLPFTQSKVPRDRIIMPCFGC